MASTGHAASATVPIIRGAARDGLEGQQLDGEFCWPVVAGDCVILSGQTGMGLAKNSTALGAKAQAAWQCETSRTVLRRPARG